MSNKIIDVTQIGYKIGDAANATLVDCVGTLEYTVNSITKTKRCGLSEEVVAVMLTGTGSIKIEAHGNNEDNEEMLGMKDAANKMAVNKRGNLRPNVTITACGRDEEGSEVVIAAPKCMITADESTFTVDNSSTEIPYLSQEFSYSPDSNKTGLYIKNEAELPASVTVSSWMSNFDATTMAK